jgi:U3 small nucleolar RNA-associated protein 20
MQLNLSASFLSFARQVYPLSQSLPQLVHHSQEIVELWLKCTENAEDEALRALFEYVATNPSFHARLLIYPFLSLLQKSVHDLRQTLKISYDKILDCLLVFLSRPISPAALTALLTCLSTLFKHLLALESDTLTSTWTRFVQALQKSKPEVQRAAAEVWATVLRRLKKKDERSCCVEMMLSRLDDAGVDDALAWTFVSAIRVSSIQPLSRPLLTKLVSHFPLSLQSVSQSLHSCASPLVSALLDSHLSRAQVDNSERSEKLIKRVLTALIHHCGKAEHFSVIADLVVDRLVSVQQAGGEEVLGHVLEIVATPCSVRQGSRLTCAWYLGGPFLRPLRH